MTANLIKPKLNITQHLVAISLMLNTGTFLAAAPNCNLDISGNFVPLPCPLTSLDGDAYSDNQIYTGLVFDLDGSDGFVPDLVFGVRSLHVKPNNSVKGADINVRFFYGKQSEGIALNSVRAAYVGGLRDAMANLGFGYSYAHKSILATAALQSHYVRVGADYLLIGDNKFEPYFELNTLSKLKRVEDIFQYADQLN